MTLTLPWNTIVPSVVLTNPVVSKKLKQTDKITLYSINVTFAAIFKLFQYYTTHSLLHVGNDSDRLAPKIYNFYRVGKDAGYPKLPVLLRGFECLIFLS